MIVERSETMLMPSHFEFIEQRRLGRHERSLGNARRAFVPVVHGAFEIGEAGIALRRISRSFKNRSSLNGVNLRA